MTNLIIGAAGFVGYYLIKELEASGEKVVATKLSFEKIDSNCTQENMDITNYDEVYSIIEKYEPQFIYHLAAQSSVSISWKKPQDTFKVNVIGTVNILEAIRNLGIKTTVLLVGSSEEYGFASADKSISESSELNPQNIYALTKATCENLGKLYCDAYGLDIKMTRSFNHIGPYQTPNFVVSDFCNQVNKIEKGLQKPVISVGNLTAFRDFTDVRDVVSAYHLIMKNGKTREVYNVGSGKAIKIEEILKIIISYSTKKIKIEIDPNKYRPIDVPKIESNISKIESLGWKRKYEINQTIEDIFKSYRLNERGYDL